MAKWMKDWATIRHLASPADKARLYRGKPAYLGYVTSAFKVNAGRNAANPHAEWERKIAPRVRDRVVKDIAAIDPALVPAGGANKVGAVKHFHSLAPEAQKYGVPIGALRGLVNPGHYAQVDEAKNEFKHLTEEIIRRANI
jgi:hypothetical protein